MYKILTAVAVVAMTALSTVIIATVLLHSSISKQSGQIKALEHGEHSEQKQIAMLEREVGAAGKHNKLTSAQPSCAQPPRPSAFMPRSDLFYSGLPWRHAP